MRLLGRPPPLCPQRRVSARSPVFHRRAHDPQIHDFEFDRGVLHVYVIENLMGQVLSIPFEGKATQVLFGDPQWAEVIAERLERYRTVHGVWPQFRTSFHESDGLPPAEGLPLLDLRVQRTPFDEVVASAAKFRIDLMLVDEIYHLQRGPLRMNGHVIQFEPSADMVQRMWDSQ